MKKMKNLIKLVIWLLAVYEFSFFYIHNQTLDDELLFKLANLKYSDLPESLKVSFRLARGDSSHWCCNNKHTFLMDEVPTITLTRNSHKQVKTSKSTTEKFHISCALGLKKCTRYRQAWYDE